MRCAPPVFTTWCRDRTELDLTRQADVEQFFAAVKPVYVLVAAARGTGGILANDSSPAQFLRDNLAIQTNIIDAAWRTGTRKLLFLDPAAFTAARRAADYRGQPATRPLETTNEWYAIAKIAGIKMCEAYRKQYGFNAISATPTNLYGPEDNFDLASSHVPPALLRKFHTAAQQGADVVDVGHRHAAA